MKEWKNVSYDARRVKAAVYSKTAEILGLVSVRTVCLLHDLTSSHTLNTRGFVCASFNFAQFRHPSLDAA